MVVVSGSWVKNVPYASYLEQQQQQQQEQMNNNYDMVIPTVVGENAVTGCAKAILISRPNSHPFQDRTLVLDQPVKVGRSVARARATTTNAIFDCKVLSRHHALFWYDSGKFYLQDTKSSNGTFVNNNRLSSMDCTPHEVSSGDLVQFGVDVMENNRKVTHGCIIASLKLYLPDGKEAKASPSIAEGQISLDELYQLQQIIQDASHREQCLETKLAALQHVVETTKQAADDSWQAYIGEERLLSRISALETQLGQAMKGFGEERLRDELDKLQEDRAQYQLVAKEALCKLHTEILDAVAAKTEQERAKITAEHDAMIAREQLEQVQLELQNIAQKLTSEQKKTEEERALYEEREAELHTKISNFESKLDEFNLSCDNNKGSPPDVLEKCNLINDELKFTSEIEGKSNWISNDSVMPLKDIIDGDSTGDDTDTTSCTSDELSVLDEMEKENKDELCTMKESDLMASGDSLFSPSEKNEEINEEVKVEIDTRTLKYQYQTAQNELRKQIEQLEIVSTANKTRIAILEKSLLSEKEENSVLRSQTEMYKGVCDDYEGKYVSKTKEVRDLRENLTKLNAQLEEEKRSARKVSVQNVSVQSEHVADEATENLESVLDELVTLKEKFAQLNEEKLNLNKELHNLHVKYNSMCDRSHNTLFFYVAPLVLMVLYLLVSSIFS